MSKPCRATHMGATPGLPRHRVHAPTDHGVVRSARPHACPHGSRRPGGLWPPCGRRAATESFTSAPTVGESIPHIDPDGTHAALWAMLVAVGHTGGPADKDTSRPRHRHGRRRRRPGRGGVSVATPTERWYDARPPRQPRQPRHVGSEWGGADTPRHAMQRPQACSSFRPSATCAGKCSGQLSCVGAFCTHLCARPHTHVAWSHARRRPRDPTCLGLSSAVRSASGPGHARLAQPFRRYSDVRCCVGPQTRKVTRRGAERLVQQVSLFTPRVEGTSLWVSCSRHSCGQVATQLFRAH